MDTNESWKFFSETLHSGFEKYVPKESSKPKHKPFWMNHKCMKTLKKKYVVYKRYKHSHLHYDYQKYIEARNEAKRQVKRTIKEYERKISEES